ncbi:hypothetical protein [Singulisphaera sp. PoT]|uniref:hypothetical protein n=1 Tax=Singulisphaera sp. PoT TaxID=3411797 RepID=UPI003BF5060C
MAQDHTPDPYKPYNAQYDAFAFPSYPNPEGYMPNQSILQGRSGRRSANQYQSYLDELEAGGSSTRRSGVGVPYYDAYRSYDSEYDRVSRPTKADDAFYREQQARRRKYFDYLRERDPKKRARLYREYTEESKRFSRDLLSPRALMNRKSVAETDELGDEVDEPKTKPTRPARKPASTTNRAASGTNSGSNAARPKAATSTPVRPSPGSTKPSTSTPKAADPSRANPSTKPATSR